MSTPQTPDYGEPWTLMSTGAVHDRNDNLVTEDSAKLRMLSCVNACAGVTNPAKEIEAMREAVQQAYGALHDVLLSFDSEEPVWVTRDVPAAALAKLQPFIKP